MNRGFALSYVIAALILCSLIASFSFAAYLLVQRPSATPAAQTADAPEQLLPRVTPVQIDRKQIEPEFDVRGVLQPSQQVTV